MPPHIFQPGDTVAILLPHPLAEKRKLLELATVCHVKLGYVFLEDGRVYEQWGGRQMSPDTFSLIVLATDEHREALAKPPA